MKLRPTACFSLPSANQQGMVLIVGLLMVLLLTIIGVAAIRGSGLQESMAFNMRDKTVAFQAAESALRACESDVAVANKIPEIKCGRDGGVCNDLNSTPEQSINNNATYWLSVARTIVKDAIIPNVASSPKCLIEIVNPDIAQCNILMGNSTQISDTPPPNCPTSYRVTAQGIGAEKTTQVVLQSTYAN